jgi:hypothetical protein
VEQSGVGSFVGEGLGVPHDDGDAVRQWNHGASSLRVDVDEHCARDHRLGEKSTFMPIAGSVRMPSDVAGGSLGRFR